MIESYNDILNQMKNDYFSRCDKVIDMNSESGARMQAVASELFSLSCFGDFVMKQAFPQTATSVHLDSHARMRSIVRRKANKSCGFLRFYCSEECVENVKIPKGIVCSVEDNAYIQFVTVEEGVIDPTVQKYVDIKAQSVNTGYENNVLKGTVRVIVNPPTSVIGVENIEAFEGGTDDESDDSLRRRLLNSYKITPTGFNAQSLAESVLSCEEVLNCFVRVVDENTVKIYIETCDSKLSKELENEIKQKLFLEKLCSSNIQIKLANKVGYTLSIEVYKDESINPNLDQELKSVIANIAGGIGIEEDVKLSRFVSAISNIKGVKYCEVNSDKAVQNVIYANESEILKNDGVKVAYYD